MKYKKDYEKPAMQVVELQQCTMLLAGSGDVDMNGLIEGWDDGGTTDDVIFM